MQLVVEQESITGAPHTQRVPTWNTLDAIDGASVAGEMSARDRARIRY